MLEEVIQGKYVMLNRAPDTAPPRHPGVQSDPHRRQRYPGASARLSGVQCRLRRRPDGSLRAAFRRGPERGEELMAANKNLLKPQNGDPIVHPSKDMVLGSYWMTKTVGGEEGEGKYFSNPNTAVTAYEYGIVSLRAKIKVLATDTPKYKKFDGGLFDTSVGKLLFNSILPNDFAYVNDEMTQKRLSAPRRRAHHALRHRRHSAILDKIKEFGFKYSTVSGTTWGLDNVSVPPEKPEIIARGKKEEEQSISEWRDGLLSEEERYQKIHRHLDAHQERDRKGPAESARSERLDLRPLHFRRPRHHDLARTDDRHEGLDPEQPGQDPRVPDHPVVPGRPVADRILHHHARRPQRRIRHGAQHGQGRLPDTPPRRRGAGRGHHRRGTAAPRTARSSPRKIFPASRSRSPRTSAAACSRQI